MEIQGKTLLTEEDYEDATDFILHFSSELNAFPNRLTGTASETACARTIRSRLHDETDAHTRLEAYKSYPLLGRGAFPFWGLWSAAAYVLYFVSFAGGQIAGILLTLLALIVFLSGSFVMLSLFFGNRKLCKLFSPRVSYNVVGEFAKKEDPKSPERTVVIADNHDAAFGCVLNDFGILRRLTVLLAPISSAIFVLFCILKMALGAENYATATALSVVPAISGVLGVTTILLHYSPFERHCRRNNGIATALGMATFAYFAENPEFLPDGARIVYASFGGENSAHGGSLAFLEAHPEMATADVICLGDICDGNLKIVERDAFRRVEFSSQMVSAVRGAAAKYGIDPETYGKSRVDKFMLSTHGYASDSFAEKGIPTVTLMTSDNPDRSPQRKDLAKMFTLTVATVLELFSQPVAVDKAVDAQTRTTDMYITDAVVK